MSNWWTNKDRRKGIIGTTIIHALLLLLFLFLGLTYYEPPPEEGILINFGNSETGLGTKADGAQTTVTKPQPKTTPEKVETPAKEEQTPTKTQDVVDAPALQTREKKAEKPVKKTEPKKEEPQPSNALKNMLENVKSSKSGGEGVQKGAGDQGAPDGDINSKNRTGSGGGGNGSGNYMLGGRDALNKPKPDYPCDDEGRVVVKIYVDQNGHVTNAIPGEKVPGGLASTTASSCLYDKAKDAAMRTTWQPDADAPATQIGYIIYNFQKR